MDNDAMIRDLEDISLERLISRYGQACALVINEEECGTKASMQQARKHQAAIEAEFALRDFQVGWNIFGDPA